MFQQILYTQWKSIRLGLIPMVIAAFGLPLMAVQDLVVPKVLPSGVTPGAVEAEMIFSSWQIWIPIFPALAFLLGVVLALNAWNWDHKAGHIYSLSLPLPRWEYVLLKMGAGALLLLLPALALTVGSFVAAGSLQLPNGLHAYPALLSARFLMAAMIMYGVLFAMASGTIRTTVIIVSVLVGAFVGGGLLTGFISELSPSFDWNMATWLMGAITEWPGPFEVFLGNWNLVDV